MSQPDLSTLLGKKITDALLPSLGGYEPTKLSLALDDGTTLLVEATSVMYDQYSRSSCLRVRLVDRDDPDPVSRKVEER